jgi:hypothetical protein
MGTVTLELLTSFWGVFGVVDLRYEVLYLCSARIGTFVRTVTPKLFIDLFIIKN